MTLCGQRIMILVVDNYGLVLCRGVVEIRLRGIGHIVMSDGSRDKLKPRIEKVKKYQERLGG
jgi:hypothetical protein